jgi:MFS family permease
MAVKNGQAVLFTASFACALTIFDTNLIGVVLPSLVADLGAGFAQMTWIQSSFLLSFASLLMASGALSDRFGRRRMLLLGLSLFGGSALVCSVAPVTALLVVARATQGAGAAFLLVPALATIGHSYRAPRESVKAWTTWGSVMGFTMVTAPLVSSLVGDQIGWRWAFLRMVLISGALVIAVPKVIKKDRGERAGPFDWSGALTFSLAMSAWTWALISGSQSGWGHPLTMLSAATGCLGTVVFLRIENGKERPMLDLSLFRSGRFVAAVIAMLGYAGTAQVMAALLPLYLQNGLGVSFLWVGIAVLPFSIAMFLLPSVSRRLSGRWGTARLLRSGLLVISAGNLWLWFAATSGSFIASCVGMAILGAGGGLINGETQKAILGSIPRAKQGMGSGISTTARFMGLLMGFTGLSSVLALGIKARLRQQLCDERLTECPVLLGEFQRVLTGQYIEVMDPPGAPELSVYLQGFGDVFLVAAIIAFSSVLVFIALDTRVAPEGQQPSEALEN